MKTLLQLFLCLFLWINVSGQAPVISVSPDSLDENLLSGKTSEQTITIYNNGASDLTFEINVKDNLERLLLNSSSNYSIFSSTQPLEKTEIPATNNKSYTGIILSSVKSFQLEKNEKLFKENSLVGGLKILLITSGGYPSEIKDALLNFPDIQQVDIFDASGSTPTLNQVLLYHTIIAMNNTPYANPAAMGNVLADYVDAGGGLILTVATFASGWEITGRLLADDYFPINVGYGPAGTATLGTFNASHPIMQGVTNAVGNYLIDATLANGAELIASWINGWPFVATKGKNVVAVNIYVTESGNWTGDIPLILHNAAFWAGRCSWLSAQPESGTIPAGSSMDIIMKFNAAGLIGGEYDANIVIESNDPVTPELIVPAHLTVTNAPAIFTETNFIDFGEVFLGVSDTFYLEVKNIGSQDLLITNTQIQPSVYTVYPPFAGIDPGESKIFTISFLPTQVGSYPGTFTLTSNDPLFSNYVINLNGQGVEPPVIVVNPDSLVVDVLSGATKTETLTIGNQGESNLNFDVSAGSCALQFDGINDVVMGFDDGFPSGNSNRTMELWFNRINQPVPEGTLMGYGNWGYYDQVYEIIVVDGNILIFSQWGNGVNGNTIIQSNQWYHVAVVNIGNQVKLYLNGELEASGNVNIYTFLIGFYLMGKGPVWDEGKKFNGIIDEVRLWAYPRTQQEIQQFMNKELNGSEQGLVGYWNFNEGNGNIAHDLSINANHGLLNGGVTWTNSSEHMLPNWLLISPDSGICPPNSSLDIELLFDATELDTGDYYAALRINSNDPVNPSVTVPVHMIVSTTVGVEYSLDLPIVFNLFQNYPNPFNPSTTIKYSIPELSKVSLILFDLLGEKVTTLVNEEKSAGNYSVEFNAASLPSGVYFYQLKAGEFIQTKKMILLK